MKIPTRYASVVSIANLIALMMFNLSTMNRSHFFKSLFALAVSPLAVAKSLSQPLQPKTTSHKFIYDIAEWKQSMQSLPIKNYVDGGIVNGPAYIDYDFIVHPDGHVTRHEPGTI